MSNVFLSEGTFNLSSGTANIIGSAIGASNLLSGSTVKVNSNKQLYSSALAMTDVQGLTTALGGRLSNPSSVPVIAPSFVKSGGTSSQYLMADGTVTTGGIGATGPTGPNGADGLSSSVFVYTFTTQTSGDPASGVVYLNDAPVGATYLYVSHLAKDGHDLDQILNNVSVNSNLIVQRSTNSNIFAQYTVTSKTVFTGYVRYGLTYIANTGTLTNNSEVLLIVQQAGPAGPQGIQGVTGPTGAQGPAGSSVAGSDSWITKQVSYHTTVGVYSGVAGAWFGERGGTTTLVTAVGAGNVRTSKLRSRQPYSSVANGQDCGWFSSNTTAPNLGVYVGSGWKAIFNFGLGDTSTNAETCTFVGLWADGAITSTSGPTFNNTTTIASFITHSVGLIQEKVHNVWHFYTRGISGNTTIATSIPCTTPSTTWFNFEIHNPVGTNNLILTLIDQGAGTTESTTFVGGGSNTVGLSSALYFLVQRSMASAGGVTNSAILETTGFKLLTC